MSAEKVAGTGVTAPSPDGRAPRVAPSDVGLRYHVRERLGIGGMGEVVLAFDERLGREVAVKRLRTDRTNASLVVRFLREVKVQGRLEHPSIVPVHDLAYDDTGAPFFVMKRLSGRTLAAVLAEVNADQAAPPSGVGSKASTHVGDRRAQLLRDFVDVCLAVEFAHQQHIVHRDLKPANIMLGDFGEVYVLDWGVARDDTDVGVAAPPIAPTATDPSLDLGTDPTTPGTPLGDDGRTEVGTVLGTPGYMAPEQVDGERVGPTADVYALGCILFEIVAGQPLHPRGGALASTAAGPDARPSVRTPGSPPELDAICVRATAQDPAARHPSARALAHDLERFLDGDRDLAMRRSLADQHVATARASLAQAPSLTELPPEMRRAAMRAAGRALALDPSHGEAAELVSQLMLTPPREVPAEVRRRLDAHDVASARRQGWLAIGALLGYLMFVPLMMWSGVRAWSAVAALVGLVAASALGLWIIVRRGVFSSAAIYGNAAINACLIGAVTYLVGPLLVAPTLVLTTLMGYAAHPRLGDVRVIAGILGLGVFVPWGLELAGVIAPSYAFVDGSLVITSPALRFAAAPVQVAFAVLLVVLMSVVAILSRALATRQRRANERLEMHAWQLQQLMPAAAGDEPTAAQRPL